MRWILACIDGTGSRSWRRADGFNSHVYRFYRDFGASYRNYWHGPGTLGSEMPGIVGQVTNWIFTELVRSVELGLRQDEVKICLVGHSRGAVAVIEVANRLQNLMPVAFLPPSIQIRCPIRVQFMGLYDAVDRSLMSFPDAALSNVDKVYHAIRLNRSWSGSRWSFGSCTVGRGQAREFDTAHGGIGGDPGYFDNLMGFAGDTYCNALQLVLTDDELLRRYGAIDMGGPDGIGANSMPRFTQLTGTGRERRIDELTQRWRASWSTDVWIREGAATACGANSWTSTSPHHPFLTKDNELAQRLASILSIPSLSHA
jgi:hypothetical protein